LRVDTVIAMKTVCSFFGPLGMFGFFDAVSKCDWKTHWKNWYSK